MSNTGGGSIGAGAPSGGGVGTISGGRVFGGGMERSGGAGTSTFSSKSFGSFKPGMEANKPSIINLKNGLGSIAKVARSESLAFRAEGARPMIDLKQPKVEFKNSPKKFERSGRNKTEQTVNSEQPKTTQPIFERPQPAFEKSSTNAAERKQILSSIIKSRSEVPGYKFDAKAAFDRRAQIKQAAMQALKKSSEPVIKTYTRPVEKTHLKPLSKTKIESAMKTRIEQIVNNAVKKVTKVYEKIKAQPKTKTEQKAEVKTQTQVIPETAAKFINLAKIDSNTIPASSIVLPKPDMVTQTDVQTLAAIRSELSEKVSTDLKTNIQSQAKTASNTNVETNVKTQIVEEIKQEISQKQETKQNQGVTVKEKDGKTPNEEDKKPDHRLAYFEEDAATNEKRGAEVFRAFDEARRNAQARSQKKLTGEDVSKHLDAVKLKKAESKSIDKIDEDGSAKKFIEYIAQQGEIKSVRELRQLADAAVKYNLATNLTEHPHNQVLGKQEAFLVHNYKNEFPAWLDGKPAIVKMKNDYVEV